GFRSVGAIRPGDVTMKDGDAPARLIAGLQVSGEVFDVLGTKAFLGRTLRVGDDAAGADPSVVISYGLWQELGGTSSIVGHRITLDGRPRTIVGVMPRNFWFPSPDIRLWRADPLNPEGRNGSYQLVGRVAPGVDVHHLGPQLQQITRVIGERFRYSEKADKTKNASVTPLRDDLLGSIRPAVVATFVTMALILLIACANVAALMLGQVEGRSTELAVRAALGATRGRITQQLVVEALLVGLGAGICGAALAAVGFRVLAHALPLGAWSESASFDWTMFAAALGIAIVAVLLVVLVPTVALWRGDLRDSLNRARTGGVHGRGGRLEHSLVVAEVAIAMLIATGAALLVRSVANRYAIDPGINVKGAGVVDVVFSSSISDVDRRRTLGSLTRELAALPGVTASAAALQLPLRGESNNFDITIAGHEELPSTFTLFRIVTVDYAKTVGLTVRAGRWFTTGERPDSGTMSIVINEALAKKYFPGENPVGRFTGGGFNIRQRIIGVVSDASEGALKLEREPVRYYVSSQTPWMGTQASLIFRTSRPQDAESMLDVVRRTVQKTAPGVAVQGTTTMQRVFDKAVGPARQVMSLLALLSGLALVLGGVGIYGVISHFATR
ncbi:MAG TPA: ABC transporter permease, partial [Gemmatimonadaceae bacterium]